MGNVVLWAFLRGSAGGAPQDVLYVSWLGQVSDEGHHHADIHTCADGNGESSQEQSPPGGDTGQREVSLGDSFAGLDKEQREIGEE